MNISAGGEQFNISVGTKLNEASQQKAKTELRRFIDTVEKTTGNIKINVKINEAGIKTVVKTIKGDMNELVQVTTKYNKEGKILSQTINRVEKDYKNLSDAAKQAQQSQENLNSTVKHSKSVFDDFIDTFMKMAKFNTINLIYDAIVESMSRTIEITREYNEVLTEFIKVSDLSGESLQNYTEKLGILGLDVARTTSEMIDNATQWKKSGFTDEESAQLAKVSAEFQNIADEELSAADAANVLISSMKGFDLGTQQAEHIVDVINEISNTSAVSSADIAQGLANVASVSHTVGNSLEETVGMLTAMVETTRSASKSSRGLTQISTRLIQTLDDASSTGEKLRGIYEGLGVEIYDSNGQLKSSFDILSQLAEHWNDLSENEQKYIALTSSGANQINNFTALMNNFDKAIEATETAYMSAGSASRENERYMQSINAQVTLLQASFERLVLGSGGLEAFVISSLKLANAVVSLVNNLGGLKTILTAIGTVSLIAAIQNFDKLLKLAQTAGSTLIKPFITLGNYISSTFNKYIETSIDATMGLASAEEVAAANAAMLQLALSTVVAILGVAIIAWNSYSQAQEEARQEAVSLANQYESEKQSLSDTISQLNDASASRSQLAGIIKNELGDAYDDEISKIEDINELRQKGIEAIYEEAKAKASNTQRELGSQYQSAKDYLGTSESYSLRPYGTDTAERDIIRFEGTPEERYEAIGKKLDEYNQKVKEGIELSGIEQQTQKMLEQEYESLGTKIQENKDIITAYDDATKTLESTLQDFINGIVTDKEETEDYQEVLDKFGYETLEDLQQALIDAGGSEEDFNNAILGGVDALNDYANSILNATDNAQSGFEELNEAIAAHTANLQSIQSAYTTLTAAVEEYNSTGSFTAETLSKLNGLTAEQIAALETHNGVMSVNVDLLQQQFEAEKQEMISKLQLAKQIAIVALEEQYLNQEAQATGSQLETQQTINENTATTYNDIYTAASQAAAGVAKVRAALGADSDEYKQFLEDRKSIIDDYNKMIDDVKNTSLSLASANKSSAKKSSSAHKEAAKETKDAWKEAFEEEQRQLKHMLEMDEISEYEYYERLKALNEKYFGEISGNHEKYIKEYQENEEQIYKGMKSVYDKVKDYLREAVENGYEKAISALEKEEKQVLAGIKKQIEALKKEKEQVLDGIQKEIDALEKQKEQVQKYWDDQIDAIKRENEVLEQQNQLLEYQQALQQAKAQKVMVMQDGRFQLGENESAVSQAEQNLSNYEDQLSYEQQIQQMEDLRDAQIESIEERIEALEEYKDFMEEYYDEQIEAMEEYYEQVQEQYEQQIEALQAELDAFKEGYQKSEDLDNARLATEVMAANEEAEVWQARLENLAAAVTEYNRLLALMGEAGATATASFSPTMSSHENSANVAQVDHVIQSRASGDSNFADDEVALVGESPNTELVLGSKLNRSVNSGELVHLSRGSGVVNAESTSTLAGILNGIAKPNSSGIGRSTQQNFSFGNITLPNVTDADSFVKTLSTQFNNYAIQYGNRR